MYGRNRRDPMHSTGTHRKHTGRWKQYSSRNFLGIFPMISDRFPQESTGNSQEFIGKKFRPEYCFHFRCFPAGYGDFSAPFLQDPAGYGGRNLRPGYSLHFISFIKLDFSILGKCTTRKRTSKSSSTTSSNHRPT